MRSKKVQRPSAPRPGRTRQMLRGLGIIMVVLGGLGFAGYVWHRIREPSFETQHVLGAVTDRSARVWIYAPYQPLVTVRYRPSTHVSTDFFFIS